MMKPRVGVVGAGRVGPVLAARLSRADYPIAGVSARTDESRARVRSLLGAVPIAQPSAVVRESDIVVLAVPDDAMSSVVAQIAPDVRNGQTVFHVSGRHGRAVLEPLAQLGATTMAIHPAMTFTGTALDLTRDCVYGVTCEPESRDTAETLVAALGGTMILIAEADRVAYHAALAHGSNHVATVVNQAMDLLREVGAQDPGAVLRPLVTAALDNTLSFGDEALTGPVVRGDVETVRAHLGAIGDAAIAETYRALAAATIERSEARGALGESVARQLRDLVTSGVAPATEVAR
ncbi:MAG: prephenate dehydrogenase/arogenate dehydrogenase family protein [Actinomycetales bacterium]|nr:prephenate dehydrogenase/arogenate dehydrogenase family protein [Actinomycetales bacterium]